MADARLIEIAAVVIYAFFLLLELPRTQWATIPKCISFEG